MAPSQSVVSNFSGGLKTEFTGLNFPENACTSMDNAVISLIGEIQRREGINFEANFEYKAIAQGSVATNYYLWRNVGGDGQTQILVLQVGNTLYFYETSAATASSPVSAQLLGSTVTVSTFQATGNTNTVSQIQCQFSDGNGYLFVYNTSCDPFYCTFNNGVITASLITVQTRDFTGIPESGVAVNVRPSMLTIEHQYNLANQGWTTGNSWAGEATAGSLLTAGGNQTWRIQSGLTVPNGTLILIAAYQWNVFGSFTLLQASAATGSVTAYNSSTGSITVDINWVNPAITPPGLVLGVSFPNSFITLTPFSTGFINTWFAAEGNYPSNADIWYEFKDASGAFNPQLTEPNVSIGAGQAPQGHFLFSAFSQLRTGVSGIAGLTDVKTTTRPRTGTFWAGRVWYAGVDAAQQASGDAPYYTWTENIYFSQIVTQPSEFGYCYQVNDPTDETLNELLPTDGGVIVIQGCGAIHKLFPLQNALLVFARNGVWLVSGNQGIGFTANAYSINKISSVQTISSNSFVDVNGTPVFWNEEGIYMVSPDQNASPYNLAGFKVEPLTVGTILSFYNQIPLDSKRYAKGSYDPISYTVTWVYRSTEESGISNKYQYDSALTLNTYNKAFYPYSISSNNACYVTGIQYVNYPSGSLSPTFKYLTFVNNTNVTFSEENDSTTWFDWFSYDGVGVNYNSPFTAGYKLDGKGLLKWSNNYVYMYADNTVPYAYNINAIWDYAGSGDSGRYSNVQTVTNFSPNFNKMFRRHKLRGHGISMQININSVPGQPYQFFGWSMADDVDASV